MRSSLKREMKTLVLPAVFILLAQAKAGVQGVRIDTSADRVESPLALNLTRVGTIRPRAVSEIRDSNWTVGCETLDRDFADFEEYKEYLAPLGIKTIRLQAGWAKCEREKGKYDFSWLDRIIDFACARGVNVLLETGYGNPLYKGGGGFDLGSGFPTSEEALAAWDAWVDAMSRHFKGRVRDWAMWNEPDLPPRDGSGKKTPRQIADFNLRTARIIRRNIPDARLAGLSLAFFNPKFFEECLKKMGGEVSLFKWFIYHAYAAAPEQTHADVEQMKEILAKYNPSARLRQGESGAPSEMATLFALSRIPWSEYSQAKWNMRRMLDDLGHDVDSSVFTICDFNHVGREINLKGLLRANGNKEVIAVKRAYYAVQNVASVFDDTISRVKKSSFGTKDATLSSYEYRKADGRPLFVFWIHADKIGNNWKKPVTEDVQYSRPADSFETRPAVFTYAGRPLSDPVWVDLLTGRIYEFPKDRQLVHSSGITYVDVPVYDSPCLLTERSVVMPAGADGVFENPVYANDFPDPTTWRADDGTYRATSTALTILKSRDFRRWEPTGRRVFTRADEKRIRKEWKSIWAPDVFKIGDGYLLYVSLVNSAFNSAIAVYSSKSPEGPFSDGRIITRSRDTGIRDTIDPEVVRDDRDGTLWLFFGSTGKMHRVKLAPDGKSLAPGATYEHVAGLRGNEKSHPTRKGIFEGGYLHRRNGWWYLFASHGCYWNHTYSIAVGRARTLDGPFLDRNGRKMTDGYATPVIESKKGDMFFGPGHNGEIVTIDGHDYIPFHCHVAGKNPKARPFFVTELTWDTDGWPRGNANGASR